MNFRGEILNFSRVQVLPFFWVKSRTFEKFSFYLFTDKSEKTEPLKTWGGGGVCGGARPLKGGGALPLLKGSREHTGLLVVIGHPLPPPLLKGSGAHTGPLVVIGGSPPPPFEGF